MREIKYSYCLDKETRKLIYIGDLTQETRYNHSYECLECGKEMEANMGPIKRRYFSHKSGCTCDGESYLHKLAKKRILKKFIESESFPILFRREVPCSEYENCMYKDSYFCKSHEQSILYDLKKWNDAPLYDYCQEEVWCDGFRPDLLLKSKAKPKLPPIFIEIFKTHESTDDKINSNNRIIETVKLKSEADIDSIIENGFVENVNCKIFGFAPKMEKKRINGMSITRVIVYEDGISRFFSHGEVKCEMKDNKIDQKSVYEFNVLNTSRLIEELTPQKMLLPQQIGLALAERKGLKIRNCMLCNSYRYNEFRNRYMCINYKKIDLDHMYPKPIMARNCIYYRQSVEIAGYSLTDLQRLATEVK